MQLSTENVLTVRVDFPGAPSVYLGPLDLDTITGQPAFPASFKFGFAASTGASIDIHEIQSLVVSTVTPDLIITKTHSSPIVAGQTGTFTLNVTNSAAAGPTTDTVTVTDTLPTGLTATGASGPAGPATRSTGRPSTCTRPGQRRRHPPGRWRLPTITVNVAIAITAAPTVVNVARVTTANDSNAENDTANDVVPIIQIADVGVVKTAASVDACRPAAR